MSNALFHLEFEQCPSCTFSADEFQTRLDDLKATYGSSGVVCAERWSDDVNGSRKKCGLILGPSILPVTMGDVDEQRDVALRVTTRDHTLSLRDKYSGAVSPYDYDEQVSQGL